MKSQPDPVDFPAFRNWGAFWEAPTSNKRDVRILWPLLERLGAVKLMRFSAIGKVPVDTRLLG